MEALIHPQSESIHIEQVAPKMDGLGIFSVFTSRLCKNVSSLFSAFHLCTVVDRKNCPLLCSEFFKLYSRS